MLRKDEWQHILVGAVRSAYQFRNLPLDNATRAVASILKPIPSQIPPYNMFTSIYFQKCNEQAQLIKNYKSPFHYNKMKGYYWLFLKAFNILSSCVISPKIRR